MSRFLRLSSLLLVLFHLASSICAQDRAVLYSRYSSKTMQALVNEIRNPRTNKEPVDKLPPAKEYFVRIAQRQHILDDHDQVLPKAVLAFKTKPLVFLTTPESIFGKSLVEIYAEIGYEAEGIIRGPYEEMVAVVFRYPDNITVSEVKNGDLDRDWSNRIYKTTWDNILSLLPLLAENEQSEACKQPALPSKRICLPKLDTDFILSFPLEGKLRVKTTKYRVLQGIGGSDWKYRRLLEDTLSVFEHFRGDSRTENELLEDRDKPDTPPQQLREVIAPNMKINDLKEVAVIELGKLVIDVCYSAKSTGLPKCPDK